MATSSIHIEAGNGGYLDHNSRERETANAIFNDEPNFCSVVKQEAFEVYRSELKIRTDAYTERTGQKLQKNVVTHLSAIVNFNKEHTPEDIKRVCDLLERKFDTKVIQYAMHRDEGRVNEDGTPDKNYHAHIEFLGLNSKGEGIRRQLTRAVLSNLQSEVAKELGMERGRSTTYTKEEYKLITADLKKPEEYGTKKEYNTAFRERAQELNIHKPKGKRLGTYDYKFHKQEIEKAVKEAVLATQKELKAEMAKMKEQLQQVGAGRAEYAALEQLNRELKEQIRAKDLTVNKLQDEIKLLQLTNKAFETEHKETKSTPAPKGENQASRAVEAQIEAVHLPDIKPNTSELDIRQIEFRADEKAKFGRGKHYVAEVLDKHTRFGILNRETFAEEMGGELKETATILSRAQEAIRDLSRYGDKAKSYLKISVESSKKGLEAIFTKIVGKSLPEVKNERIEQERALQQEKIKQAEEQRAKEPKQVKAPSRGLRLG